MRVDLGDKSADARRFWPQRPESRINLRKLADHAVGISLDEATAERDACGALRNFLGDRKLGPASDRKSQIENRTSEFLTHPVFNTHRTETEMLRYLRRLESRDLSLTTSMIPLGSCTMKLNATAEMFPHFVAGILTHAPVRA